MYTVTKVAWADLKQNKGRNILTGIAIILTTLLLFVIPTIGFGQIDVQKAVVNELYPTFHGMYRDVDAETVERLRHRAEIETLGIRQDVARIPIEDGTIRMISLDETARKLNKIELEAGDPPAQKDEIAVSDGILEELGISAGIGDRIRIPFQIIEPDGLGYAQTEEFVITGILPTTQEQSEHKSYVALAASDFMDGRLPVEDQSCRVMFRIAGAYELSSDAIEEIFENIAADLGIPEGNVVANSDYLWANYVDPAFYTGIVVVLIIVVLAGIMTVCSIYYISMIYKVQEYGKMKALGATKRQIRQMVFREGMLVAAAAVPAGLALGTIFSKVGSQYLVAAFGQDTMKEAIAQVMSQGKVTIWRPWIYLMALAATLAAVAVSLVQPMRIASRISPVEAMRYNGDVKIRRKERKGHREMSLAALTGANLSRNKKRTILTVVTLSLMGILFMALSTVVSCADPEEIARETMFDDLLLSVESTEGDKMHPEQEWAAICKNNPLNEDLEKEIGRIPGVKKITRSSSLHVQIKDLMDGNELWGDSIIGIPEDYASRMEDSIIQGETTYEDLLQGDRIVVDKKMLHWAPDWKVGDTLDMVLKCADADIERSFKIAAIADMPEGLTHYAGFLLPKEVVDTLGGRPMDYHWSIATEAGQTENVENKLREMLEGENSLGLHTYEEEVAYREKNTGFTAQICYVFMAVLGGIGIMNLVNTMINSIYVRRRELGILQAIGLSDKQMVRMLQLEGLFYTAGTLGLSLGIGSAAGYLVFLYAREDGMLGIVSYHYPFSQAVFLAVLVAVIQFLLTYLVTRMFRKQSMIERIRFSD